MATLKTSLVDICLFRLDHFVDNLDEVEFQMIETHGNSVDFVIVLIANDFLKVINVNMICDY